MRSNHIVKTAEYLMIYLMLCVMVFVPIAIAQVPADTLGGTATMGKDLFTPYLREVPEIATVVSEEIKEGVRLTRLRFRSIEGSDQGKTAPNEIYAVLGRPEGTVQGKRPAILICHGGGGAASEINVLGWAKLGFVALSPDLPGHMGDKNIQSVTRVKGKPYGADRFVVTPDPRASVVFDTIVAGLRAFNLLASQEDVDPKRIGITGISWGGYTTLMLTALLEERVAAAFSLYGSGSYLLAVPGIGAPLVKLSKEEQETWIKCFDPSTRARQIKAPVLMYAATNDIFFLPPAVMATYEALGGPKYLCFGPGRSHWIDLPGGTVSWTGPTFTEMEPAYFLHMFAGNQPSLPQLRIVSGPGEAPAFAVEHLPASATVWAYYSSNVQDPWTQRQWQKIPVELGEDGLYRPKLPDNTLKCDWYGGVSFSLKADLITRPMSLSTVIARFDQAAKP